MKKLLRLFLGTILLLIALVLVLSVLGQIPRTIQIINSDYPPGYIAGSIIALLLFLFIATVLFVYGIKILLNHHSKDKTSDSAILDEEFINKE